MSKLRKTRSDKTVKSIENELGVSLYKKNGSKQPKNKKLGTIRSEEKQLTPDQLAASKRVVKFHPKSKISRVNQVKKILQKI